MKHNSQLAYGKWGGPKEMFQSLLSSFHVVWNGL